MSDIDRHSGVAGALARRLRQYAANRLALPAWMHEDWLPAGGLDLLREAAEADLTAPARRRYMRVIDAWLGAHGVALAPLAMFRADHAALAALPVEPALQALRLRALHFRRAELRYWIDRHSRERLAGWLGTEASGVLRWLMETPHAPQLDRLMRMRDMPPLDELDDERLAWEGFCLCRRAGWCGPHAPLALLRFAWPRDSEPPDWLDDVGAAAGIDEGIAVVRRLPVLFEEFT